MQYKGSNAFVIYSKLRTTEKNLVLINQNNFATFRLFFHEKISSSLRNPNYNLVFINSAMAADESGVDKFMKEVKL